MYMYKNKYLKYKNKYLNYIEKIRRMWKTGLWGYFSNKKEKGCGNILGLYRSLLNNSGYIMFSKQKTKIINEGKDIKTLYYIEKKSENCI